MKLSSVVKAVHTFMKADVPILIHGKPTVGTSVLVKEITKMHKQSLLLTSLYEVHLG